MLQRNPFVQPVPSSIQKKKTSKKNDKSVQKTSEKDGTVPDSSMVDLWDDKAESKAKIKKKPKSSIIPAVEVESSGCSFSPDHDSHQDALALAVADELQKIYQQELGPEPIPLVVPGEIVGEEEQYFLEADYGIDDDDQNENLTENGDTNVEKRTY